FFFQAEDGIRDLIVTGVQTCALPILRVARPEDLLPLMAARIASRTVTGDLAVAASEPRSSLWRETGRRFRRHRLAVVGTVVLLEIGRASCRERVRSAGGGVVLGRERS